MSRRLFRSTGFQAAILGLLLLIIVVMALPGGGPLSGEAGSQVVMALIGGWWTTTGRMLAAAVAAPWIALSAVVLVVLLIGCLDALGRRWWPRATGAPWPRRAAPVLVALLVIGFVAGTALVALIHQTTWLATTGGAHHHRALWQISRSLGPRPRPDDPQPAWPPDPQLGDQWLDEGITVIRTGATSARLIAPWEREGSRETITVTWTREHGWW